MDDSGNLLDKMREGESTGQEENPEVASLTVNPPTISERLTPMRANTMKECEQLIEELRKENFSLKLRIYFLEDRCRQKFGGGDIFNMNIELNVQVESLRNDVYEKQELLKKAYLALDSLSKSHQEDLKRSMEKKETEWTKDKENILRQLQDTEKNLAETKQKLEDADTVVARLQAELHDQAEQLRQAVAEQKKNLDEGVHKDSELEDLKKMIDQLGSELESKQRLEENYVEKIGKLEKSLGRKEKDIEGIMDDQQESINKMKSEIEQLNTSVTEKDDTLLALEERLKKVQSELETEKTNSLKKNKLIKGLTQNLHDKMNEVQELQKQILKDKDDLNKTRQELYEVSLQKHKNLVDSIEKKEQELNSFRDMLNKTRDALKQSEDAVQQLQDQLQREKKEAKENLAHQTNQYQLMIQDLQHQLHGKDLLIQQLTDNLKEKDKQLHEYLQMMCNNKEKDKDELIQSLEEKLKNKEECLKNRLCDQIRLQEDLNAECQQLRLALREREGNLEKANEMLLSAQETINMIEKQSKMREMNVNKLSTALKAAQNLHKEQSENHSRIMAEKDDLIQHLQNVITVKNKALEETLRLHMSDSENKVMELERKLLAKDQQLQDLMEEKKKSALGNERSSHDLIDKLKMKDSDIKNLIEKQNLEMADKIRDLQKLRLDISRKDYEIQTLETNSAIIEKMQDSELKKLRSALEDKDKTIKTLVDSCQQKESLIRQLQESNSQEAAKQHTMTIELQCVQDELRKYHENEGDIFHSENHMVIKFKNLEEQLKKAKEELFTAWKFEREARQDAEKMQGRMMELERENQALLELRKEYVHMRDRASEASSPCRSSVRESDQKMWELMQQQLEEMKALRDALSTEQNIWASLCKTVYGELGHPVKSLEAELLAMEGLRQQLEQGIDQNNKLRSNMFKQLKAELDSLNRSSQSLDQSGVGISMLPQSTGHGTSPIETMGSGSNEIANLHSKSFKAESHSKPSLNSKVNLDSHGQCFSEVVERSTVCSTPTTSHSLQLFLQDEQSCMQAASVATSSSQQQQQQQHRNSAAVEVTSLVCKDPSFQMHSDLQQLLESKTKENLLLRSKLGLLDHIGEIDPKFVPDVNQLKKEVGDLKTELNKASNTISILKQQIALNMQNEVTETQCKPELIVHMAKEIRRLREERKSCQCVGSVGNGEPVQNIPDKENFGYYHRRTKSRKEQSLSLSKNQTVQSVDDTTDSDQRVRYLSDKIKGLDMLVSQQSQEIDRYKTALENSGLSFKKSPFSKNCASHIYGGQKFTLDSEPEPDFQCQKSSCAENVHRLKSQVAELKDQLQRDLEIINSLQSELAVHKSEQQQQRLSSVLSKDHNSGRLADFSAGLSPMFKSQFSSSKVTPKTKSPHNLSNTFSSLSSKFYLKGNLLENSGLNGNISEVVMLLKHLTTSFNVCKQLSTYVVEIENSLENCVKDLREKLLLKKKINNLHAAVQHLQSLLQGPYGNEKQINTNNNNSLRDPTPSSEWIDQLFMELQPSGDISQHSVTNMDQKTLDTLSEDALQSMRKMTAAATEVSLDCPDGSRPDKYASKLVISGSVSTTPTNRDRRKQSASQSSFSPRSPLRGLHNQQSANTLEIPRGTESCSEASIPNNFSLPEVIELDITGRLSLSELYLNQQQPKESQDIPRSPANIAKGSDQHPMDSYLSHSLDQQLSSSVLDPTRQNISLSKQHQSWLTNTESANHSKSLPSSPSNTISSKDAIRSHLLVSQDLSNTLRQEISVYDFLETSTANSLNLSANQSLNNSQLESFKKYLLELRAQRIKLEGTVDRNERLQEKLIEILNHDKIKGSPSNVAKDIARLEEQKHQLTYLQKLLSDQQNQLDERQTQVEQMKGTIDEKDAQICEKDKLICENKAQISQLNNQLKIAQTQIKTLEQEILDLKEQLSENKDLNSTLKLELSMYEQLDIKSKAQPKSKKFDIREFLIELKNLRKSMERCISTNNILRQKLEEILLPHNVSFQGDSSNNASRSQHNLSNTNHTANSTTIGESNKPRSNLLSHAETSALTKELERLEAEDDDQQVDSAHGSGDSELASSYGNNTSELLKQTIDIIETSSSSLNQQPTSLSRNLFGSPKAGNEDEMADLHPLQTDSDGAAGKNNNNNNNNSKGPSSSSENNNKNSIKSTSINSETHGENLDMDWASSVDFINGGLHNDKLGGLNSASTWPGSSVLSKDHITYWSFDPPGNPVNSPVRISSDLRSLFAIGKLDDYELLRKENNEMSYVVRNLQARLRERIKVHKSLTPTDLYKNKEYSTLRDLSLLVENLNVCLGEESRLISNFWLSQLPLRNRKGQLYDSLKFRKNGEVIAELDEIQRKCDIANEKVKIVEDQLNTTNLVKENNNNNNDDAVVRQLKRAEKALQLTLGTFEPSELNGFNQDPVEPPVRNEPLAESLTLPMMTPPKTRLSTVKDEV